MFTNRKRLVAAAALTPLVVSCSGDPISAPPPAPTTGTLDVMVLASGIDPDSDGYRILLDTTFYVLAAPKPPTVNGKAAPVALDVTPLPVGTHTLRLDGIASNCIVNGTNPREFEIIGGARADVSFDVQCLFTGVEVKAHTTGFDYPAWYDVTVDGRSIATVGANDSTAIRVPPGTHVVGIGLRGDNCAAASGTRDTVNVAARTTPSLAFEVSCERAVRREKIAYAVDTIVGGVAGPWIVLANLDGSGGAAIARGDRPTWSPDGTRLAYSNALCDPYDWYYDFPCGGGLEIINPERWTTGVMLYGGSAMSPAWAPNGQTVAFTRCCATVDRGRIYVNSVDGLTPEFGFFVAGDVGEPAWSPDGLYLVFSCTNVNGMTSHLCITGKDGSGLRVLDVPAAPQAWPAWSPDGKRIAFTSAAVLPQVVLLDVNTMATTTLMDGRDPAWSPDGTKLLVAGIDGLYVINADGTNKTRITKGGQRAPAWRP